jgi:hypothetical protein
VFPHRGVGGVSILFLRLAEYIASHSLSKVCIVDYSDGFMMNNLKEKKVGYLEYHDDRLVHIPHNAVMVFQSITPWSIYPSLRPSGGAKVVFWNCHPFNLIPVVPPIRRQMQAHPRLSHALLATLLYGYCERVKSLVRILNSGNGLFFMDVTNLLTTEKFIGIKIPNPIFMPIPTSYVYGLIKIEHCNKSLNNNILRVSWLGRLTDFKYFVLKRALIEINNCQRRLNLNINVDIVGDGEYRRILIDDCKELSNISVNFIDHIPPNQINEYMMRNVDLLIAMGTSALDGALLGIPTLLLDISYKEVPETYKFKWIHDQSGYSLGGIIGLDIKAVGGKDSMLKRMKELINNRSEISKSTIEYVTKNHDLAIVVNRFLFLLQQSKIEWCLLVRSEIFKKDNIYLCFTRIRNFHRQIGDKFKKLRKNYEK